MYLDPMEDFRRRTPASCGARAGGRAGGRRVASLFNDDIDDPHFSAAGSEVWAAAVGRRLIRLLEDGDFYDQSADSIREPKP